MNDCCRGYRIQCFAPNLRQTINVLYPAVLIKEFVLGEHYSIRAVLKMELGLAILKCEEFNSFPVSLKNMSTIRNRVLRDKEKDLSAEV